VDLFNAVHELYGVKPEEFMDTRKRLVTEARTAGAADLAKEIGALRRPTLSAWAVNLLAREAGEDVGRLLEVGAGLRAAWASGDAISGFEQRRNELVDLLVWTARRLAEDAGRPLREPAVREVEETLQAAAVDPEVAEDVRVGRLSQPRSHAGFVPAGFTPPSGTVTPKPKPQPRPRRTKPDQEQERRRREEAARAAAAKAEEAAQTLAEWQAEADVARRELDDVTAEAETLQRRLDEVLSRKATAERRARLAERELTRAGRSAEEARRKATEAAR
jgi:DNA segregation ATPase FtsK/SpoIIIE-like protein